MGQTGTKESKGSVCREPEISKKLVNDPLNCVKESLEGFVMTNNKVKLLEGHNVVVRADLEEFKNTGKVALITGGGSGHEPFAIGYIGSGGLTSSVVGNVFASPTSSEILTAIKSCTNNDVLLIVTNYTGDRLNFGKAAEVAKVSGTNVEMVVVADDCALTSKDESAGRRGLCGTIFIHKMAGAMAEEGKTLNEMAEFLREAVKEIGTISISLSPCSIPGRPPNFTIDHDTVEFGLGIHGEAGVSKIKMSTVSDLVSQMLEHVKNSGYLPSLEEKEIALIVNNLGGTSNLELTLVAREAVNLLREDKVTVSRSYVGTFVTSMEMAGVSLTLMVLNDERKKYLDAECHAPAWKAGGLLNQANDLTIPCTKVEEKADEFDVKAEGNGVTIYHCLKKVCEVIIENEEKLNDLDRNSGDGDTGSTFARGAKGILCKLSDIEHVGYPINDYSQLSLSLSYTLEAAMGGSSGALLSLFFNAAASALKEEGGGNIKSLAKALELGINAVKKYGGAKEGYRTMIDALSPALNAFKKSQENEENIADTLKAVSKAARDGATETIKMAAKAGRASYTSDSALTKEDPGAYAVALVFEAIEMAYSDLQK